MSFRGVDPGELGWSAGAVRLKSGGGAGVPQRDDVWAMAGRTGKSVIAKPSHARLEKNDGMGWTCDERSRPRAIPRCCRRAATHLGDR